MRLPPKPVVTQIETEVSVKGFQTKHNDAFFCLLLQGHSHSHSAPVQITHIERGIDNQAFRVSNGDVQDVNSNQENGNVVKSEENGGAKGAQDVNSNHATAGRVDHAKFHEQQLNVSVHSNTATISEFSLLHGSETFLKKNQGSKRPLGPLMAIRHCEKNSIEILGVTFTLFCSVCFHDDMDIKGRCVHKTIVYCAFSCIWTIETAK